MTQGVESDGRLGEQHTIFSSGAPLQSLSGAFQLVAPLAQRILAVVNPSFHVGRENLPAQQCTQMPQLQPIAISGAPAMTQANLLLWSSVMEYKTACLKTRQIGHQTQ